MNTFFSLDPQMQSGAIDSQEMLCMVGEHYNC